MIELDLGTPRSTTELHVLLWSRLGFPTYYGQNWDAFWDCITDAEQSSMPRVLRLQRWDTLRKRLPRDAHILRELLQRLPSYRPEILIEWVD